MPTYYHDVQSTTYYSEAESKEEADKVGHAELRRRALLKLNTDPNLENRTIINIIESHGYTHRRPRQDNSDTWYDPAWVHLLVFHKPI